MKVWLVGLDENGQELTDTENNTYWHEASFPIVSLEKSRAIRETGADVDVDGVADSQSIGDSRMYLSMDGRDNRSFLSVAGTHIGLGTNALLGGPGYAGADLSRAATPSDVLQEALTRLSNAVPGIGIFDFMIRSPYGFDRQAVRVSIPLRRALPPYAAYQIYNGVSWNVYEKVYSAIQPCPPIPPPGAIKAGSAWHPGLKAGHSCVLLELEDNCVAGNATSAPSPLSGDTDPACGTIADIATMTSAPPPDVTLALSSAGASPIPLIAEGAAATLTLTVPKSLPGPSTIIVLIKKGKDFISVKPSTIVFDIGQSKQTVMLTAIADGLVGTKQSATIAFESVPPGAVKGLPLAYTINIRDRDKYCIGFEREVVTVMEHNSITEVLAISPTPIGESSVTVVLDFNDDEITVEPAKVTFTSATSHVFIQITAKGDQDLEQYARHAVIIKTSLNTPVVEGLCRFQ